jgi:polysaccharide deacetylase 2 family uncharacterized protein YibQ
MARSPEPPEDADGDGEFGGIDIDIDDDFARKKTFAAADADSDSSDADYGGAGDDDYGGAGDDDDFDNFAVDAFAPDDDEGADGGISGALIGLIAASLVFFALIGGVVGWLMISFDPEDPDKSLQTAMIVTELAPPPNQAAKPKPRPEPEPEPEPVAQAPEQPAATTDPTATDEPSAQSAKPKTDAPDEDAPDEDQEKASDGDVKSAEGKLVIKKTIKEEKFELAAVDPLLIDETSTGPLPKIAPDGRQPWQVYARPFTAPDKKVTTIAIVMAGLGLSKTQTLAAIQQLPGAVTLSFAPYARDLGDWIAQSRAAGHEVLLELPMEPYDYPENDPGPHTLLTSLSTPDNIDRLNWLLGRFPGYVGVTNFMGAKFTANEQKLLPIIQILKERGLLYLDAKADRNSVAARIAKELNVPIATNNRFIDREASRVSIDARLFELERISKSVGVSVGMAFPFPVTVERLAIWIATLEKKGIVLAPVSAIANRQPIR